MKWFFLLAFLLVTSLIQTVSAEIIKTGVDHDIRMIEHMPDGRQLLKWTSVPPRISNEQGQYVNYIESETDQHIKFHSASTALVFNKQTCTLKLYDDGMITQNEKPIISSISNTLKIAESNTNLWKLADLNNKECVVDYKKFDDSILITATKQSGLFGVGPQFKTIYDITYSGVVSITYQYTNQDITSFNNKFGYTQSLDGDFKVNINGQILDTATIEDDVFFSYEQINDNPVIIEKNGYKITYDSENYIHDYLWGIKIRPHHISIDFTHAKGPLGIGEILEVDPIFSGTPTSEGRVISTTGAGVGCPAYTSGDASLVINKDNSGNINGICTAPYFNFNVISIPNNSAVTAASLTYDVTSATTATNCDFKHMGFNASNGATTYNALVADTGSVVDIKQNDASCTTVSDNKVVTFNTGNYAQRIQNDINGDNTVSLGVFFTDQVRGGTDRQSIIRSSDASLSITYVSVPPNPPSSLSGVSQAYKALLSWSNTNGTGVTGYYIGRSLDNSTWPAANKTLVGNVTSYLSSAYWRSGGLTYYINVTSTNPLNSTKSSFASFITDSKPSVPLGTYATGMSGSSIKVNWQTPNSNGNDPITGYRVDYCITCTVWSMLVNNTNTLNYNQTGIIGSGTTVKYRVAAWNGVGLSPYTANFTGRTWTPTTGSVTTDYETVGDVIQINSTVSITNASPSPVTVSQLKLYRNGTLQETKTVNVQISAGSSSSNFDPFWNRITDDSLYSFKIYATVSNSTGMVQLSSSNFTSIREYDPSYFNALTNPSIEGQVNYTMARFDNEDGILLKVNRINVVGGSTWEIDCITQTNSEAATTRNQSLNWPGTWRNYSNVGYFNSTWTDFRNTHGYITCFNPPGILFSTTSYTNSSLALFGIQIFDDSYGSMLGVPVGIFFLAMAGSMANKRTAPTWIIVVLAMAGTMAAIGFFTLNPLVWGLALVTGLLGVLVNQKVF